MLLVEATLRASPLDGIGLFAAVDMPAGMPVWERDDILTAKIDASRLPTLGRAFVWKYAWIDPDLGEYVLDLDDARFINYQPNAMLAGIEHTGILCLARNVKAGEEITCSYDALDRSWYRGPVPVGYTECRCGAVYRFPLKHVLCPKCEQAAL